MDTNMKAGLAVLAGVMAVAGIGIATAGDTPSVRAPINVAKELATAPAPTPVPVEVYEYPTPAPAPAKPTRPPLPAAVEKLQEFWPERTAHFTDKQLVALYRVVCIEDSPNWAEDGVAALGFPDGVPWADAKPSEINKGMDASTVTGAMLSSC